MDAGDLPASAQVVPGTAGTDYTGIAGNTTATNGLYDSDMFRITIGSAVTFTASNVSATFTPGVNNFDSQLALFNAGGVGVVANADAARGGRPSSLPFHRAGGHAYLLLSGSGRYPLDSAGKLIFPNYTDGTTDPSGTYAAQSALPITSYTGNSNEGGGYSIAFTLTPVVPEPGTYAFFLVGASALAFTVRLRRTVR